VPAASGAGAASGIPRTSGVSADQALPVDPVQTAPALQPPLSSPPPPSSNVAEVSLLLKQQAAAITALQSELTALREDVSALRAASLAVSEPLQQQPQQQQPSSPQQQQQQQQQVPDHQKAPQRQQATARPQRYAGSYHSMTVEDFRALPDKLVLVRHAESQGNLDAATYCHTPDYEVPLSARGWEQATAAGAALRELMEEEHGGNFRWAGVP
jgi:Histidine phosphatase superfamily (branch 1)